METVTAYVPPAEDPPAEAPAPLSPDRTAIHTTEGAAAQTEMLPAVPAPLHANLRAGPHANLRDDMRAATRADLRANQRAAMPADSRADLRANQRADVRAAPHTPPSNPAAPPTVESPAALTGDWFYVPYAEARKGGYPPEFIELRLSENAGAVHGRYRARYRVADRAISPNVAFQFEGPTAAGGGVLPWRGPGGAKGEVTLRLLADGNLEVAWEASQLGEELGLISGTATLVRKRE